MLIVSNWKAYVESVDEAKKLYALALRLSKKGHDLVLAPASAHLALFSPKKDAVALGAQDVSLETAGAHTGEVTAGALKEVGVSYVIVGHSERRALGETDAVILEKIRRVLAEGMTPIVCIGESARDEQGAYLGVVRKMIESALAPLSPKERTQLVFAYEPVWAIGKSGAEAIQEEDLTEMVLYLRKVFSEFLPGKASDKVRVLYGGSVEASVIRSLAGGTGVDGFLIGHASAEPASYKALVEELL